MCALPSSQPPRSILPGLPTVYEVLKRGLAQRSRIGGRYAALNRHAAPHPANGPILCDKYGRVQVPHASGLGVQPGLAPVLLVGHKVAASRRRRHIEALGRRQRAIGRRKIESQYGMTTAG